MSAPYFYDYINVQSNLVSPSMYRVTNSNLSRFFQRYLLQKAMSVFDWKLPDDWSKEYFLYVLYMNGYLCVINTDKFGVIPQACTLTGYDIFYRPTEAKIYSPLMQPGMTARLGRTGELIKLMPDYGNIMDLVTYYADQMALASESISVNLINTKTTPIFEANSKSEAETLKKMFDSVARGEPCVVTDGNVTRLADTGKGFNFFYPATANMFVSDKLIEVWQSLSDQFNTDIGIPNANTRKKERMLVDEVNANNVETESKCALWLDTIQGCVDKVNGMFGLNITVDWRVKPDGAGNADDRGTDDMQHL